MLILYRANFSPIVSSENVLSQPSQIETPELRKFIESQIDRVKKHGPSERPPMIGLRQDNSDRQQYCKDYSTDACFAALEDDDFFR